MFRANKAKFGTRLISRSGFLAKVYLALAVQLAITAAIVTFLRHRPALQERIHKYWLLFFLLNLALIILLSWVPMPLPVKLLLFIVFAASLAFTLHATSQRVSPESIRAALASTTGIFLTMTAVAFLLAAAGIDLGFLSFALLAALIGLIVTYLVLFFLPVSRATVKAILLIGMVLFSVFIAFDTNVMLQPQSPRNDFLDAAIGLYLDLINLFSNVLSFLGMED